MGAQDVVKKHYDRRFSREAAPESDKTFWNAFLSSTVSALLTLALVWKLLLDRAGMADKLEQSSPEAKKKKHDEEDTVAELQTTLEGAKESKRHEHLEFHRTKELGEHDPEKHDKEASEHNDDTSSETSSSSSTESFKSTGRTDQSKGVGHLLETDVIPEIQSIGVQRDSHDEWEEPSYLQFDQAVYGRLDSITEEDSDDARSHSSETSQPVPLSSEVADEVTRRLNTILQQNPEFVESEESPRVVELTSESSEATARTEDGTKGHGESFDSGESSDVKKDSPGSIEHPKATRDSEIYSKPIKHSVEVTTQQTSEVPSTAAASEVKDLKPRIELESVPVFHDRPESGESMISVIRVSKDVKSPELMDADLDRDQTEMLVSNADQFSCFSPEEGRCVSNTSMSITLDQSKDDLLDQSVCSNPQDESVLAARKLEELKKGDQSDEEDLPGPPAETQKPESSTAADPTTTTSVESEAKKQENKHRCGPERLASMVYGYGEKSPLLWKSLNPENSENKEPKPLEEPYLKDSYVKTSYSSSFRPPPVFGSSLASHDNIIMDEPPNERPPPPPPKSYADSTGYRTDDELMSERNRSRATVREIPIHRSHSAFGPSVTANSSIGGGSTYAPYNQGGTTTHWTTTKFDPITGQPQQEEYYRREVLTRTLVTRSTEALSAPQPLNRSSPVDLRPLPSLPPPRDDVTVEYRIKYLKNVEEEERRIKEDQERRKQDEDERRRRIEEQRRIWEIKEQEHLERLRREREKIEDQFQQEILAREANERNRIERDRLLREEEEQRRRKEWERLEEQRRLLEESELEKRRRIEQMERERLERERLEAERIEKERLERERLEFERIEKERIERERIERERREIERLEIERIERIKREQREKEEQERQRQREEQERLEKERQEAERIAKERLELERRERELLEKVRREAEERERQRREEQAREAQRRADEARDREVLKRARLEAEERERIRIQKELEEKERLENLRRNQERLENEKLEAEKREQQRLEDERREREFLEEQRRNHERREKERLEEEMRERQRQEEERLAAEKRRRERLEAQERERQRQLEEAMDRQRMAPLERTAAERERQRQQEREIELRRAELERQAREIKDAERFKQQQREAERLAEEQRLKDLADQERRNAERRDQERAEAAAREEQRRLEDRRSREHLEQIHREKTEKERWEIERRKLLEEHEAMERRRQALTSKETLEKLTRQPYYSRENLSALDSQPEVTTKVERQIIERVDRTLWSGEDTRSYPITQYPHSSHDTQDDPPRERRYDINNTSRDDGRGASSRSSKVKARIEKAKQDFLSDIPSGQEYETRQVEYRGPLLQKFNSGELRSRVENPPPYPRVGPSPYDYAEDMSRSKSVLDYTQHQSRREVIETLPETSHLRSKSADYLMDKKLREDALAPENELQKNADGLHRDSAARLPATDYTEYERYRKSMDKIISITPSWYQDSTRTQLPAHTPTDLGYSSRPYSRQHFETSPSQTYQASSSAARATSPVGGISFPAGMFDRYKYEIEDMRRSRSSLQQAGVPAEHTKVSYNDPATGYSREEYARTNVRTISTGDKVQAGYTVSTVPSSWNLYQNPNSRVIEVADTFVGQTDRADARFGGKITIEEVLDAIFQDTNPNDIPADPSYSAYPPPRNIDGPGIYTPNQNLMDQLAEDPHNAEYLLRNEPLIVRCRKCDRTKHISHARNTYVSCKHCYTYYCSRMCRADDWDRHKERCSFARITTLCKEVIVKVRNDPETQYHMSKIARDGYRKEGRGSVNIRILSAHSAQMYLKYGWKSLLAYEDPENLLFYYPIQQLVHQRKEPSLIQLCRKYNPEEKFILSVSIIADIEQCPQTPPPDAQLGEPYSAINKPIRNPALRQYDRHGALVPTDV
ncbi:unnamed protein product [Bursaphelenchus okinawaensis]|uniref:MYND-type domain-containing protein n=1 Tax=Bursaphelenchus okinawaensis TaxID=465554 RepID=A0A811LL37_9BILA|nr:unnamed protein product [Bursaphelenchus okinawaensis]CAG9125369.1 unnamed protein product [Bursaphelenchus okinawaensis]